MSATEDYEVRVADVFLSWGWAVPGKGKIQPLPAAKLITATRRLRPKIDGGILVCGDAVPGLFYRFASMPVAHQIRRSNADIVQFFRTLAPPAAAISWLRLYPIDYGWEEKAYFENALPDIAIFQGAGGFVEQINSSRLFVGTSNQTTYLETMSAGFPTIVFWNPSYNEIRREAQPAFDALENAGIFHRTPESAAQHVNKVAADPRDWWNRPQTLAARQEFCARFARTSRGWISEWTQALQSAVNNRPECS
jgi:putative transferase (TIGR04331 family)